MTSFQDQPASSSSPALTGNHPGFDEARAAARWIRERTGVDRHRIAVVLGSGWKGAAELLGETAHSLPLADIPGFHTGSVPGHETSVMSIRRPAPEVAENQSDEHILVFGTRTHFYENRDVQAVAHTVRTAAASGAEILVLTNGAGGLNANYSPGEAVLISDHINLTGETPLSGPEFVDLSQVYSPRLRALAREVQPELKEGVYVQFSGPNYETPAEVRMAKTLGGDLVGMSTALDAIAARHAGLEILGLSLVTNPAAGLGAEPLSHEEVLVTGKAAEARISQLLAGIVERL